MRQNNLMSGSLPLVLFILSAGLLITPQPLSAAFEDLLIGARPIGMASAFVALADNADAVFLNPAGLAQMDALEVSLFYARPFAMEELAYGTIAAALPTRWGHGGFALQTFGTEAYRETTYLLSYSRSFRQRFFYGGALRYMSLRIPGYGSDGTWGLDFGLLMRLTPAVRWAVFTRNVNRPQLGRSDETLPQSYSTGFSINALPGLLLSGEVYKDIRFPGELRWGFEFRVLEPLALRAGVATNPSRFTAGLSFGSKKLQLDYAFYTHNDLGLSQQFSVSFRFQRAKTAAQPVPTVKPPLAAAAKIHLNTATVERLQQLPGIGEILARRIVEYRKAHGPFRAVEELLQVPGIGKKKLESIRGYLTID